jgi:hypothetical protein
MKRGMVLFFVVLLGVIFISATVSSEKMQDMKFPHSKVMTPDGNPSVFVEKVPDFGKIPLYFIRNKGQVDGKARFYARASRYTLWLTKEGLVFDSVKPRSAERGAQSERLKMSIPHSPKIERDVSRLMFVGSAGDPGMVPIDESKLRVNYFIGKDKSKWHCDVPTSMAVLYKSLYKNIDLKVYGSEKQIEYDWIVKPGGSPEDIRFEYKNVKGTRIDEEGNLLIETDFGELMHKKPVSYQPVGAAPCGRPLPNSHEEGKGIAVNVTFKRIAENTYGFEVGTYDKSRELVIDPVVLAYSTYLGGALTDRGYAVTVDARGNTYVTGDTSSPDFPTRSQYQGAQFGTDVFITKLDTTRSGVYSLIYSTYLGGDGLDWGWGIAVDENGNAYVTGQTRSTDFPCIHQYQADEEEEDVFVTRLDTTQNGVSSLIYSTYLGGDGSDWGEDIAVDASGNAYVTGRTRSPDFPTRNQYQGDQIGSDAFITKLDTTRSGTSSLIYSTYLGGGGGDGGRDIVVAGNGIVYVTGTTSSRDFPIRNQYQGDQIATDAFITKLDTTRSGASSLIYSTYLGGGDYDFGTGIAVDAGGMAYVAGWTGSTDFPTRNQFQDYQGGGDVFVTKLDTTQSGSSCLIYSTYLGGGSFDYSKDIAIDACGNAYVTGTTNSMDFPTLNQYQGYQGRGDVFVTKLGAIQGGHYSLIYSTYLGGRRDERGFDVAVDSAGNVYVIGDTFSNNFPTFNQFQKNQFNRDAFVTKISAFSPVVPPTVQTTAVSNITQTTASSGGNVTSNGGAAVTARGVCWSTSPNPTTADSHTTNGTGTGTFKSSITGLTPGTAYHVRAYAVNSAGTSYGSDRTFTTMPIIPPTVTTTAVSDITTTTASSGGNVTSGGGAAVTARGVCWNSSPNPTASDSLTTNGTGTGMFTSSITGLTPDTTYFVRAYATNSAGTAYGNERTFTTSELPQIELNRNSLNFGAVIGGSRTGSQDFIIGNSGGGSLNWTASTSDGWIQVTPVGGSGAALVMVSIDPTGMSVGTYTGTISISDTSAANSPQSVSITLKIYSPGTADIPFGEFSTPIDGSTLRGSIPAAGWALDDIEVSSVKIYRDGNVYIGDAVFVEGARPDVESAYPEYPFNYRAVWGYQILTNFLPNGGNGTFTITAIASDSSGNEVTLGSKTITCDNANAVKPFGAIDTPTQGGDASGSSFVNFGWALTPQPNTIPTDGSTIKVWIDGVPLAGNPTYNLYREDIAIAFPGYNNSAGAVGYYFLDTMGYTNGMHTIAWSAADNGGNADGIGSRYFRVLNVGNSPAGSVSIPGCGLKWAIQTIPVSSSPIYLKKGYKTGIESEQQTETIYPDKDGIINVDIMEDERIEIKVGSRYRGYILVDGQIRGLPVGSTMDVGKGVFYWQPGPGFLGEYRFVFVGKDPDDQRNRRNIDVSIRPNY